VALSEVPDYCYGPLAKIRPWEHELELVRDGETKWLGPISEGLGFSRAGVAIRARDCSHWGERRVHPVDRNITDDLARIFELFVADAMLEDPSPGLSVDLVELGTIGNRTVLRSEAKYVADSLRELADSGLYYTTLLRQIRVRPDGVGETVGTLLDAHVQIESEATLDGLSFASEFIVVGEQPADATSSTPIVGRAGGFDERTGLVQITDRQTGSNNTLDATHAAQAGLAEASTEPVALPVKLQQTTPLDYDDLVPGNHVPVLLTLGVYVLNETLTIDSMSMDAALSEQITLNLVRKVEAA
jgi:hypothetical protein